MPFVPAPNIVQAELIYSFGGQITENVLHYEPDGALTDDLMAELADELISLWGTNVAPLVANDLSLTTLRVTDLTTQFSNGFDVTTGLPISGGLASLSDEPVPANVALAVKKNTAFRGRSRQGRIYHMGLTNDQVLFSTVDATTISSLVTAYTSMLGFSTAGATWEMVVLSRFENNVERTQALATEVTFLSADSTVDSQRRRLPGRGE